MENARNVCRDSRLLAVKPIPVRIGAYPQVFIELTNKIYIMVQEVKQEVKKVTGDFVQSIANMKVNEEIEISITDYDTVMSSARYRAKRKYGVLVERVGPLDYDSGYFRIKRTA